jgi:hypothetical protein
MQNRLFWDIKTKLSLKAQPLEYKFMDTIACSARKVQRLPVKSDCIYLSKIMGVNDW